MTVIAIHQPNYIPYLGFFDKIKQSDIFVILDNVQFVRTGEFAWQHRQKIRTREGSMWLTIPVKREFKIDINKVQTANQNWQIKHWKSFATNYSSTTYWNDFSSEFESFFLKEYNLLVDVTIPLIIWLADKFDLDTEIKIASEILPDKPGNPTDTIIEIINRLKGDSYFSGKLGTDYLEKEKLLQNNINLIIQDFHHPTYKQKFSGFIPNLSAIDYLLNVGGKL